MTAYYPIYVNFARVTNAIILILSRFADKIHKNYFHSKNNFNDVIGIKNKVIRERKFP